MDNQTVRLLMSITGAYMMYVAIKMNGHPVTFLLAFLLMFNRLFMNKEVDNV